MSPLPHDYIALVEYIHIQYGVVTSELSEFNFENLVYAIIKARQPIYTSKKRFEFKLDLPKCFPKILIGQNYKIERTLSNIIAHFLKDTLESKIFISANFDGKKLICKMQNVGIVLKDQKYYTPLEKEIRQLYIVVACLFISDIGGEIFIDEDHSLRNLRNTEATVIIPVDIPDN